MADEYSLWRVIFSYEIPRDHAGEKARNVYTVVALDKDEAETKSFVHFSGTPLYNDLNLSREGLVRKTVTRIKKRKLTLPELSLEEDSEQFSIVPRLTGDHSIEYLVTEIKGK